MEGSPFHLSKIFTQPAYALGAGQNKKNSFISEKPGLQLVKNPPTMQEIPVHIPGSGRSPGERIGYPFQYSWASLIAQMVKSPPAMRET